MKQETFTDIEYSCRKKKTRREEFLEIMDEIIPWDEWVGVIEPYYPKGKRGRPPMGIEKMLRIYLLQIWFNLSDWERYIEHCKSSIRSKVEHVFRIIKCQFGYKKRLSRIKEKRKSFVCPVCLCQFVFAGDCRSKTFHNINQGGSLPFYRKESS